MTIEANGYEHQIKRIDAMYSNKDYKSFLEHIYFLVRGGDVADKKSAIRYETVEDLFSLNPILMRHLQIDFEPAYAAIVDMCVINKVVSTDINYANLNSEVLEDLLCKIESLEHAKEFDENLYDYIVSSKYSAQFDARNRNTRMIVGKEQKRCFNAVFAARSYRNETTYNIFNENFFESAFGTVGFSEVMSESKSEYVKNDKAAILNVMRNYAYKLTAYENPQITDFYSKYPYLTSLIRRHRLTQNLVEMFTFTKEDERDFKEMMSNAKRAGTFNPSGLQHSGQNAHYLLYLKHKAFITKEMKKAELYDADTNCVYLMRFASADKDTYKVGVSNYNNLFVRAKILRDDYTNTRFYDEQGAAREARRDSIEIVELHKFYVSNEARKYESEILNAFRKASSSEFTISDYAKDEFITVKNDRHAFSSMLSYMKEIDEAFKYTDNARFYTHSYDPLDILPVEDSEKELAL